MIYTTAISINRTIYSLKSSYSARKGPYCWPDAATQEIARNFVLDDLLLQACISTLPLHMKRFRLSYLIIEWIYPSIRTFNRVEDYN